MTIFSYDSNDKKKKEKLNKASEMDFQFKRSACRETKFHCETTAAEESTSF